MSVLPPVVGALVAAAYLLTARRMRRRGDRWPVGRDLAWVLGWCLVAAVLVVDGVVPAVVGPFAGHLAGHLLLGMAAPLLLVLGRPVTLALRAVGPGAARALLVRVARSRPVAVLTFPPVAAAIDAGGLWMIYRTPLFGMTHHHPVAHVLVHLHVVAAGVLFSWAVCGLDPVRRRSGLVLRGGALVAAAAAHAVLAKTLYVAGPPGTTFDVADLERAAMLMYYGGDVVEIALAVVLARQWYRSGGFGRGGRRARASSPVPVPPQIA